MSTTADAGPGPGLDAARSAIAAGPRKAYRDTLFRRWVDAKREAQESENMVDHGVAVAAYLDFMRAHLSDEEHARVNLENEVARLTAEIAALRRGAEDRDHPAAA